MLSEGGGKHDLKFRAWCLERKEPLVAFVLPLEVDLR